MVVVVVVPVDVEEVPLDTGLKLFEGLGHQLGRAPSCRARVRLSGLVQEPRVFVRVEQVVRLLYVMLGNEDYQHEVGVAGIVPHSHEPYVLSTCRLAES